MKSAQIRDVCVSGCVFLSCADFVAISSVPALFASHISFSLCVLISRFALVVSLCFWFGSVFGLGGAEDKNEMNAIERRNEIVARLRQHEDERIHAARAILDELQLSYVRTILASGRRDGWSTTPRPGITQR